MSQGEHNKVRLRRADSWLRRSEMAETDDEKFIFLWIAFNAAYGVELSEPGDDTTESGRFRDFLWEILKRDRARVIEAVLWETYSGPIRVLLNNPLCFRTALEVEQRRGKSVAAAIRSQKQKGARVHE